MVDKKALKFVWSIRSLEEWWGKTEPDNENSQINTWLNFYNLVDDFNTLMGEFQQILLRKYAEPHIEIDLWNKENNYKLLFNFAEKKTVVKTNVVRQ